MDEKGCRLTIHKQPLVLAKKGSKRVHMVAPEHAENVTVAACVNALGNPIPPMIIFKGKRMKPEFSDNLPAGSLIKMSPKGSMTSSLFVDFINHLGKYKPEGKCLLVFDGASCHLDYNIVDAADDENIVLYCLPSNTTHELQPLDKSVNKSFEHHWDQETLSFLYQNPEKKLTKARFNSIFSKVWSKCMTHENIVSGFKATGLYPYNPEAIPDEAYAPSVLTERPPEQEYVSTGHISPTPGPSNTHIRHAIYSPTTDSFDSNQTYINRCPSSPSLLQQTEAMPLVLEAYSHSNKKLVDYSSSDRDSEILSLQVKKPITVSRPIIYSSGSDTFYDEAMISCQRPRLSFESMLNIYNSFDDENKNPGSKQHTPIKQMNISCASVDVISGNQNCLSSDDDSENNIPLARSKVSSSTKSPFQLLIPTPNYAVVKRNPRRKAINYKACIVTKDLFTDKEKKKDTRKKKMKENDSQRIDNKSKKPKSETKKKTYCKNNKKRSKTVFRKEDTMQKTTKERSNTSDEGNDIDKWYCYACHTERCEDMRQCPLCQKWFHEQCLGLTKEDLDFDCPICN